MGNIIDYVQWRGDITFENDPFNEVDNLVMAYLSYVNLDGIEEIVGENAATVEAVSKKFFHMHTQADLKADKSFIREAPTLLKAMAKTARFGGAKLRNYVNTIVTEQALQFSAVEILLEDGTSYIAYRGTDDTIVGWKEDFNLSNGIVPAQEAAVAYLNSVGGNLDCPIRIGGHSKGGNLAVYAGAKCMEKVQNRILAIYNNDGPGFAKELMEDGSLHRMLPKITRIIPESCVIGLLLDHVAEPIIIASSNKGILQHDGFSWQVLGPSLVRKEELNKKALLFNETLLKWMDGMDAAQRGHVIEELFSVFEATGAQTLTQLQNGGLKSATAMIKRIEKLEPGTKEIVESLVKSLLSHGFEFL